MKITNGKQKLPMRAVIYGPEGIGKSTLASLFPRPFFVDLERGTGQLDVHRGTVDTWSDLIAGLDNLPLADHDTIVIDTIDAGETDAIASVCESLDVSDLKEIGWGHGYEKLATEVARMLDKLTLIHERQGKHVVILAHSIVRKRYQPDEFGMFDRYEMALSKQVAAKIKEWADTVLFANFKVYPVKGDNGQVRGEGGERIIYTQHHPCWDAKNRYNWPEKIKLPADRSMPPEIAAEIAVAPPRESKPKTESKPTPAPRPEPKAAPDPEQKQEEKQPAKEPRPPRPDDPEICAKLDQLATLMQTSGVTVVELDDFLTEKGVVPHRTHPHLYNMQTLNRIIVGWEAVTKNIEKRRTK